MQENKCHHINGDSVCVSIIKLRTNAENEIKDRYLNFDIDLDTFKVYCICLEDNRKINSDTKPTNCDTTDSNSVEIYLNPLTNARDRKIIVKANLAFDVSNIKNEMLDVQNVSIKLVENSGWFISLNQKLTLKKYLWFRTIILAGLLFLFYFIYRHRKRKLVQKVEDYKAPDFDSDGIKDLVQIENPRSENVVRVALRVCR